MTLPVVLAIWIVISLYTAYWLCKEFDFSIRLGLTVGFMSSIVLVWFAIATKFLKNEKTDRIIK